MIARSFPLPHDGSWFVPFIFIARRFQLFIPSSTRVELCLLTLRTKNEMTTTRSKGKIGSYLVFLKNRIINDKLQASTAFGDNHLQL